MSKKQFLYNSFLRLETEDEVRRYLRDLLTPQEIEEFAERLTVADMLNRKMTYVEISQKTSMSSTTIARVSKWLKNGRNGYKLVLGRPTSPHLNNSLGRGVMVMYKTNQH